MPHMGYMHWITLDGLPFPYSSQGIEETVSPFIDEDSHTGMRWGMYYTDGSKRYSGPISAYACIANIDNTCNWAINNYDTPAIVVVDTGDQLGSLFKYTYDLKIGSLALSATAEGQVEVSMDLYGWGGNPTTRERTIGGSTSPPDMSGPSYNPIPWYLSYFDVVSVGAASGFSFVRSDVTSWSITISNNEVIQPNFDGYQVPGHQQAGTLTVEGSMTLYNSSGIAVPSGPTDVFALRLYMTQGVTGTVFNAPLALLQFPICVPTSWPDAGAARGEKKTLNLTWSGRGNYTQAPVIYEGAIP